MPIITNETGEGRPTHEVLYENREAARTEETPTRDRERVVGAATMTGGSSLELIGGAGAVVLAIIGLAGYWPLYMAAIATIAIGGALLAHGAAASARVASTLRDISGRDRVELGSGLGGEVLGGAAGVTLGILALVGIAPMVLLSVAAIVVGGAILIGAPAQPNLPGVRGSHQAIEGTSGAMALAGAGAVVLGILALLKVGPVLTLVMVAMLAVGGALFLEGSALTARFARRLQHA